MMYLATFDDPGYLSLASIHERDQVIVLPTLRAARDLVWTYQHDHRLAWTGLDGLEHNYDVWSSGDEVQLTLYAGYFTGAGVPEVDPIKLAENNWHWLINGGDAYPDRLITVGPRGGIRTLRA